MSEIDLFAAAERWPGRAALETDRDRITFSDLAARAQAAVGSLVGAVGPLAPGQPVAWVARPSIDGIALGLGLVSRGIPLCPLHPSSTPAEREAELEQLAPQAFVDGTRVTPWARANPGDGNASPDLRCDPSHEGVPPETPLAILFTSGSTSVPRPVVLSHRAFIESARASASRLGWHDRDKWLLTLPLAHVGGLSVVTRCLLAGRTIVLPSSPSDTAATLSLARRRDATLASLVPTQLVRWLAQPDFTPWPALRAVLMGGAATPPSLFESGRRLGLPLLRTYGLTETCSQVATQVPGATDADPTDCGPPLPGYEVRSVADVLEIRTPSLLTGTWPDSPANLRPGGWLRTSDLGWLDALGHVHVSGRRDDVVVTGGENVDLREIDAVMVSCPGIRQACAVGLPDETWGVLIALVVEAAGDPAISTAAVAAHASEHLARHKRPRRLCVVSELPTTQTGKIDRKAAAALGCDWAPLEYAAPK